MKNYLVMLLVLFMSRSAFCEPILLEELKDKTTSNLLSTMEILSEKLEKNVPYFIKIVRVSEYGECDGESRTCPKQSLLILVSSRDEYPEQKVYLLPKAYGWEFVRYVSMPKFEGVDEFAVIELKRKVEGTLPNKASWRYQNCDLRVNLDKGQIECR